MTRYILNGKEVVECEDLLTWTVWMEDNRSNRRVAYEYIDGVTISTVFTGVGYRCSSDMRPILFETLVFGGELNGEMTRCRTWAEAEVMHKKMVNKVMTLNPHRQMVEDVIRSVK